MISLGRGEKTGFDIHSYMSDQESRQANQFKRWESQSSVCIYTRTEFSLKAKQHDQYYCLYIGKLHSRLMVSWTHDFTFTLLFQGDGGAIWATIGSMLTGQKIPSTKGEKRKKFRSTNSKNTSNHKSNCFYLDGSRYRHAQASLVQILTMWEKGQEGVLQR